MENYRLTQTGEEVQDILNGAAMQTDLTAENERAEGAEQILQGNIDEEERRAKAAEETLSGAIGDEELRAKAAEEALGGAIDGINAKIPAAASSENKLADQDFVNSSIETATATFRGTFNLVSDLHLAVDATHAQIATLLGTVIAEADNNDYSYVLIPTSAQTPTEIASIEKYTFGANGWAFAYALNNSGFTSAQWAAINSGITSGLVAKLNALPTNTDLLALLAGKQNVLTFDDVPVEGSNNPVKSGGVHSAIDDEKTARVNAVNALAGRVDTIEGEIPAQASSENQLADKAYVNSSISTNTATYRGSFNLVADLGLSVSATHEQIGTALAGEISTADNNDYAYVQVPTSDETPSQILKVERYKFNGTAWAFEYELNNSGFTSAQWAAINSGITSGLVGKLNALPTNDELTLALAGKQDVLTFDNTPTENSNNPVKSGGVYAADKALSDAIEAILLLIPSAATSLNKLVDTDLMNSSISTATATFRGTFNLVSDLSLDLTATHAQIATALAGEISTADNNDYAFVQVPTAVGTPTEIASTDRYKFNGTAWAFEYTLNNSGFTAEQWAAINSAITTELVAKLTALPTNAELLESLGLLSSGISGINAKIPSAASSENKLVDGTAMETYVAQIVNAIDATFNVTSTDGHVTLAITQVNGAITSVQLTTSDIASAAALNLKASQADLTALAGRVTTAEGNITSLTGRMTTAEGDIDQLLALYNALQQSAPQVIQPTDTWPVANPSTTVIYRVIDRVNTPPEYYSDYMWNGTSMVLMATYNNAVDTTPKKDSANLITSGGVFANIGAFDISEYHKSGSTLATYADLTAALAALPSDFQKGGMSIKFVQTSDNKYVQYFCNSQTFTTNVADWEKVNIGDKVNQLERVSGILLDKTTLFVNTGFIDLDGSVASLSSFRYTTPIQVKKGEIFNIHYEAQKFNVYVATFALFADSDLQNVIELSKNNGNKIDNAFICSEDGYLVISMKEDFVLDNANTAYLFKSTLINDSQLVDYNAKSFLVGKIARSFTHRKTLYGSAIRTDVRGYIKRNGDLAAISDWDNSVLLFNVENLRGRYINIFQYQSVGVAAIPVCFYNSATTFDNTTKIFSFETEFGYKQNGDSGYVIRIPGNAKTFAIQVNYADKAQWNEYYGCRIFSLVENETDNDYPEFLKKNDIICWGDSLTAGSAGDIPYANRWTTVLASLIPKYSVINAGVGGERIQDIMARNGARPFTLTSKVTLPTNTTQVSLGQELTNFYGETVKLLRQGQGASINSVNPVFVNGVECNLSLSSGTYYLNRVNAGDSQIEIETYEPFQTIAGKDNRNPYAAIFWMGTNNLDVGNIPSLNYFITAYQQIIDYTDTKNFIIIGLKEDSYIDSGLYTTYEEYFSQNYGSKFVNVREYFCKQGWKDAGITLDASDEARVAAGKIPAVFTVDGVHLTAVAQGLLANLLYKRMGQLGYID